MEYPRLGLIRIEISIIFLSMLTSKCNRGTVWEPLAPDDETRLTCLFARAKSSQKQAGGLAELGHSQIQNGPLSQMCGADKGNPVRKGHRGGASWRR